MPKGQALSNGLHRLPGLFKKPICEYQQNLLLIFVVAFLFRLALLILFPVPCGNDAAGRLYFRDTLWIGHWLPLTQALVYVGFAATQSVVFVRLVFIIITSLSAVAFTFYLQLFATHRAALIGGLLFAANPLLVFLSLMPYQEVMFIGLLLGGLAFFHKADVEGEHSWNYLVGSFLYGLACLTRYEAWLILPALFIANVWRSIASCSLRSIFFVTLKSAMGLLWGPVLWMIINWLKWGSPTAFLFHRPDHEFYAWAPHGEIMRIIAYIGMMIYWLARFGSPLILLAALGIGKFWKNRKTMFPVLWPAMLLLAMVLIFLIFIAGKEFATANRFASLPLAIMLIFVALGADEVINRFEKSKATWVEKLKRPAIETTVFALAIILLLLYGAVPVVSGNRHPDYREPYEVAMFIKEHLSQNERAVIVGESIAGAVPMAYQRVFGQLSFDKDHLFCSALLDPQIVGDVNNFVREKNVRYVAVFGGEWKRSGSDEKFLKLADNPQKLAKAVLKKNTAIIFELAQYQFWQNR